MRRSVPHLDSGLRAVALAALFGGQAACVRSAPTVAPQGASMNAASAAVASAANARVASSTGSPDNKTVVRDYWRAFSASVVSWNDEEQYQGLRAAVLRDGTIAYDHVLYVNAYAVPNPQAFYKAEWFAFSDSDVGGKELQFGGVRRDANNCQGKKGCSPYMYYAARVPENVLRNSRDSLVVRVVAYGGYETNLTIRGDLIAKHLAMVDSVSAARKAHTRAGNH